ncbi:hypothetical protein HRbin39_01424 [bacterium HR39]|nr:hypothetical protein HRbin39_01424 [bacterium HR39]
MTERAREARRRLARLAGAALGATALALVWTVVPVDGSFRLGPAVARADEDHGDHDHGDHDDHDDDHGSDSRGDHGDHDHRDDHGSDRDDDGPHHAPPQGADQDEPGPPEEEEIILQLRWRP